MKKTNIQQLSYKISTFAVMAVLSFPISAKAGFEWHSSDKAKTTTQGMIVHKTAKPHGSNHKTSEDIAWEGEDVAKPAQGSLEGLMPVQVAPENNGTPTVATPEMVEAHDENSDPSASANMVAENHDVNPDDLVASLTEDSSHDEMAVAAPEESAGEVVASENVIEGFGSDISFVIALRQVIPTSYQFAFGADVNLGQLVSWQGGKSWKAVLEDMVSPLGLTAKIRKNLVLVAKESMMSEEQEPIVEETPVAPEETKLEVEVFVEAETSGDDMTVIADQVASTEQNMAPVTDEPVKLIQETTSSDAPVMDHHMVEEEHAHTSAAVDVNEVAAVPPSIEMASETDDGHHEQMENIAETTSVTPENEPRVLEITSTPSWQAKTGTMLKDVLQEWSETVGVELYWTIDYDYEVVQDVALNGSFQQAVASLLVDFKSANPQPYGQLHNGSNGPAVLIIKSYDTAK